MDTFDKNQILFLPSTSEGSFTDLDQLFSCVTEAALSSEVVLNTGANRVHYAFPSCWLSARVSIRMFNCKEKSLIEKYSQGCSEIPSQDGYSGWSA